MNKYKKYDVWFNNYYTVKTIEAKSNGEARRILNSFMSIKEQKR